MEVTIRAIEMDLHLLEQVKALGRLNAKFLGHFPAGAFEEYALKGQILVALGRDKEVLGYLLYRVSRKHNFAVIVHLCLKGNARGRGLALRLLDKLKEITKRCHCISLTCRDDYEQATRVWEKAGFIRVSSRPGKSQAGSTLVIWRYSHGHPDLFTEVPVDILKIPVVLDACVWLALMNEDDAMHEEAIPLTADWLSELIQLKATQHIQSDLQRHSDQGSRSRQMSGIQGHMLQHNPEEAESAFLKLGHIFGDKNAASLATDLWHIADTAASGSRYFLTWDKKLLAKAEFIKSGLSVEVIEPSHFISRIDELERSEEYEPARAKGVYSLAFRRARSEDLLVLPRIFLLHANGERRQSFSRELSPILNNPHVGHCELLEDVATSNLLGMAAINCSERSTLTVHLLRVCKKRDSQTLLRFLLARIVEYAIRDDFVRIRIRDYLNIPAIMAAAIEVGFSLEGNELVKLNLSFVGEVIGLAESLKHAQAVSPPACSLVSKLTRQLADSVSTPDRIMLSELEHRLRPAKVLDDCLPSFIVPIRPIFAMSLFDEDIAKQDLFGGELHLALTLENVYYRSPRNSRGISAPAHILWYVSEKRGDDKTKRLAVYSRLTEVCILSPQAAFKRFERLGVYGLDDIEGIAHNGQVMCLVFDDSEQLRSRIPYEKVRSILRDENCRGVIQSPIPISTRAFARLYTEGMRYDC